MTQCDAAGNTCYANLLLPLLHLSGLQGEVGVEGIIVIEIYHELSDHGVPEHVLGQPRRSQS